MSEKKHLNPEPQTAASEGKAQSKLGLNRENLSDEGKTMDLITRRKFLQRSGSAVAGAALLGLTGSMEPVEAADDVQNFTLTVGMFEKTWDKDVVQTDADLTVRLRGYGTTNENYSVPGPTITTTPGQTLNITIENNLLTYDNSAWEDENNWWHHNHNVPHMLDTTNLHLHGLEVVTHIFDPLGTSETDAPMMAIGPGDTRTLPFHLPTDHPAGLFWYHPHHHGSTAVQVATGMAGGIVVMGGEDTIDGDMETMGVDDIFLISQDIGLFEGTDGVWEYTPKPGQIYQTGRNEVGTYNETGDFSSSSESSGFAYGDYPLRFFLINGAPVYKEEHNPDGLAPDERSTQGAFAVPVGTQLNVPVYNIAPGQVVRVRMLNGHSDLLMPLHLSNTSIHLIALDGVNFTEPRTITTEDAALWDNVVDYNPEATSLVLAGGNRAEFLIQGGEADDTYELIQLAHKDQQFLYGNRKVLAKFRVLSGTSMDMALPTELSAQDRHSHIAEDDVHNSNYEVVFLMRSGPNTDPATSATKPLNATDNIAIGSDFVIAHSDAETDLGALYGVERIDREITLGTKEEWTLYAKGEEGHPFHIHVNAFEVVSIDGVAQPEGTFMDVIWCPKATGTEDEPVYHKVVIRSHFQANLNAAQGQDNVGKSVYHCHILPHEDTGMMANILIKPA